MPHHCLPLALSLFVLLLAPNAHGLPLVVQNESHLALRIAALSSAALGLGAKADAHLHTLNATADATEAASVRRGVEQWKNRLTRLDLSQSAAPSMAGNSAPAAAPGERAGQAAPARAALATHWADCPQMNGRSNDGAQGQRRKLGRWRCGQLGQLGRRRGRQLGQFGRRLG